MAEHVENETMVNLSLAGIVVAVVAVIAAYFAGYANGVAFGREEGYSDGKRDGTREGSIRAYAVGFDRGKHNRESDDDDDDDDDDADDGDDSSSWRYVIVAATAGVLVLLWLSSQSPTTPPENGHPQTQSVESVELPAVRQTDGEPAQYPAETGHSRAHDAVALPRIKRSLPTASPVPSDPYRRQDVAPRAKTDDRSFPHPPPGFRPPQP